MYDNNRRKKIILRWLVLILPVSGLVLLLLVYPDVRYELEWLWIRYTSPPEKQLDHYFALMKKMEVNKPKPPDMPPDWTDSDSWLNQCPLEESGPATRDEWIKLEARVTTWCWYKEILTEYPSQYIEFYDDYALNKFYANKNHFAYILNKLSKNNPGRLLASVITGPTGALWSYQTFVFQTEGDHVLAIQTTYAHARFRYKAAIRLSHKKFNLLLNNLMKLTDMMEEVYTDHKDEEEHETVVSDWDYYVLICWWDENTFNRQPLFHKVNGATDKSKFNAYREKAWETLERLLIDKLDWTKLYYK